MEEVKGRFKTLGYNLNKIVEKMITNEDLCKLLYYMDDNPLKQPPLEHPEYLIKGLSQYPDNKNIDGSTPKIYSYSTNFDTNTETGAFIYVSYNGFRPKNSFVFKSGFVFFNIIIHKDKWFIENNLRLFAIMQCIDELFNETRDLKNIGALTFCGFDQIDNLSNGWIGYELVYTLNNTN